MEDVERPTPVARLERAIADHQASLEGYRRADDRIIFETLRAIDYANCRELFEKRRLGTDESLFRATSTWGTNEALDRVMPRALEPRTFSLFPSHRGIQDQVDDFLFKCGSLAVARRAAGWVREGIVDASYKVFQVDDGPLEVLELASISESHADEQIGRAGLRWASSRAETLNKPRERELEVEHRKLLPHLQKRVRALDGWRMEYTSTPEIDAHFHEWAKVYLARIHSQDLFGLDEIVGGRPFGRYVEVLAALSARAQKHMSFASILQGRERLDLRNLLTDFADYNAFVVGLAGYLDAERAEIEAILACLTLSPDNIDVHARAEAAIWAPLVRSSSNTLLLPVYGLDINPFLFLISDLRSRYERDWFRAANAREARWIGELAAMFEPPRWRVHTRNLRLKENGKDVTDLDFVAFDERQNELTIFQLKWQQPVAGDERLRRSASKNLLEEGNRWVSNVMGWLDRNGVRELMNRLGFPTAGPAPEVKLVVLGRYGAHYTGHGERDGRAVWSDWANFLKARERRGRRALSYTLTALNRDIKTLRKAKAPEQQIIPLGDLAVVLNVKRNPLAADALPGGDPARPDDAGGIASRT